MNENEPEVYTPSEAVEYLRKHRGIIFEVASLRSRRRYNLANASHVKKNITLWTKRELDAIEPSKRTRRVNIDDKDEGEGGNKRAGTSMLVTDRAACMAGPRPVLRDEEIPNLDLMAV